MWRPLKKVLTLQPEERIIFYDEFSVSEQNSCHYGWARRNTRPRVSSNEKSRRRLNGMLAIDVDSGEEWLWLSSHAQSEDVARYMAHLALEMDTQGVEQAQILLDNNTTHRQKMQGLYLEEVQKLGLKRGREIKTRLVFTFLPAYSPKLNLVEYAIHLLRLRCLHHRPYNMKMQQIEERIQRELNKKKLLSPEQIRNILQHIEEQVNVAPL